ncbi:MAG TPA: hypothetical protein VMW04_04610 [Patescibacteria group bacterium]|nr:hypothetical protein [Patescibacteria group bacterium]
MLGSGVFFHLLLTFIYFAAVSLLRSEFNLNLVWLWLGALSGTFLLDIDHFLFWFWTQPEAEESVRARVLLKVRNYRGLYSLLKQTHEGHNRLIFHSATFQAILLLLAFYVLTASNSLFGAGLVVAMNLHLLKDEWFDWWRGRREALADWLFWQIKGLGKEYLPLYLFLVTVIFLALTVLLA